MVIEKVKPTIKRVGSLPVNSRVSINYTGKKPIIKFGYPSKNIYDALYCSPVYLGAFLIFVLIGYLSFFLVLEPMLFSDAIKQSSPSILKEQYFNNLPNNDSIIIGKEYTIQNNISKLSGFNITVNNITFSYLIQPDYFFPRNHLYLYYNIIKLNTQYEVDLKNLDLRNVIIRTLILLLCILIIPLLFTAGVCKLLPLSETFNRLFPYINKAFGGSGFYIKFKRCPGNKIIEIPMFNNVFLNYNATKDFSKYLTHVEIKEHPFSDVLLKAKLIQRFSRKNKISKESAIGQLIKNKKKNIYLWNARFIFSQIPKKGSLEVLFN